jgi:maltooligosyltrehalose trehalohydrolase
MRQSTWNRETPGAICAGKTARFCVWAPHATDVALRLIDHERDEPMARTEDGYFTCAVEGVRPGDRYFYLLDGEKERPDPASRSQPEGVHGPSAVVDGAFPWTDERWLPPVLRNSAFYELHVGAFTPEGTFEAVIEHLPYLKDLGVTTLEIMPVAQFPGARNWGYDGVLPYAPQHEYGGATGLKRLVNACHAAGLAVFLDVVYNHMGPEGNYFGDFGPYFTDRYKSLWGNSINFDGPQSDHVRRFFIRNAIYWLEEYHLDGLRLDATDHLFDLSAVPFLQELAANVHEWAARANRRIILVAENDSNDRRLTISQEANGVGLDAQWLDNFHHVLHVALTGEQEGYYLDYQDFGLLLKVLREGFAYSGQYSPARGRRHGTPSRDIPADRFVVATQNHDQVGNRMLGERLTALTDFAGLKLAAAFLACSPYVPLLFMGEEYGETAPFNYFVSHGDPTLIEAVQTGRAAGFAAFAWKGAPPDPQAEETFLRSKLDHSLRAAGRHALLHAVYRDLLALRRAHPALTNPDRAATSVYGDGETRAFCLERRDGPHALRIFFNFDLEQERTVAVRGDEREWRKLRDAHAPEWSLDGEGQRLASDAFAPGAAHAVTLAPKAFAIYARHSEDACHA